MTTNNETPRPKPGPPKPKPVPFQKLAEAAVRTSTAMVDFGKALDTQPVKPKFVRKPHLMEKPFSNHEGLQALAKQMEKKTPTRRGQRQNKNQEKK